MIVLSPRSEMRNGKLDFEDHCGWQTARRRGAFYLKEPAGMDFSAGIRLAQNYYLPRTSSGQLELYRGYRENPLSESKLGYSNPKNDQVEFLQIEAGLWKTYFPEDVAQLLWEMNELARSVLKNIMVFIGACEDDIPTITGGVDQNKAFQYCIFNHFRSEKHGCLGFTAHKDSGFLTVLYTTEAGLECWDAEQWVPLDPLSGHLTVVLGHSLEILTANMREKVSANYHRVRSTANQRHGIADRFSFGVYIGPRMDQDLYQYDERGTLLRFQSFLAFQKAKAAEMKYEFHPRMQ